MISKNIFSLVEKRSEEAFFRFNPGLNLKALSWVIEGVRILFAVIMLFRYLMSYDSSPLFLTTDLTLLFIFLYVCLCLGFLTPLVTLALIFLEFRSPLFIAVKVNVLLPLFLLFLSAGQNFSLDKLILKNKLQKFSFNRTDFPKIRFYLLLPYALICFLAFWKHMNDDAWTNLSAVHEILSNPVITSLPHKLRNVPLLSKILTIVQLLWEVAFLPLMFFPIPLLILGAYGALFFLVSATVIHLSFLGHFELLYFALVFHQEIFHFFKRDET